VVVGEPARARGCVGGVLRLASASGTGRNPKGRGSAPGRGQSAGQSCGSTTAKGRAPVALQLRRAPPMFCRELLLHRRRERLDIREHRPTLRIQGERARLHLANAHQQLCGTLSQLCEELGCLLLSKSCFGIGPAAAKLSSGVAHKKDQGRTPGGRAGLSNARTALRCAGRPRPPRQRVDQHLARRASQSIERCGIEPNHSARSVTTLQFLRNNAFRRENRVSRKKLARRRIFDGAHLKGRSSID